MRLTLVSSAMLFLCLFLIASACGKKPLSATLLPAQPADPDKGAGLPAEAGIEEARQITERAALVAAVLKAHCLSCHGADGSSQGGFASAGSLSALIEQGYVVPGQPDQSPLYTRMLMNMPPPESPQPSAADKETVRAWIAGGALVTGQSVTRAPLDFWQDVLPAIEADQAALDQSDQAEARYFTLWPAWNTGITDDDVEGMRQGLRKLLNSISRSKRLSMPKALDSGQSLYRIFLKDLGWNRESWNLATENEVFFAGHPLLTEVASRSGASAPVVRADLFISENSVAPRYYQVQAMRRNLDEFLKEDLGRKPLSELYGDFLAGKSVLHRLAFNNSQVSAFSRVIERFAAEAGGGQTFWMSHEFNAAGGQENPFEHPLGPLSFATARAAERDGRVDDQAVDVFSREVAAGKGFTGARDFADARGESSDGAFVPVAHELIFEKPNGMLGFFVALANGQRVDEAPTTIRDSANESATIAVGASCMSCHFDGVLKKDDQLAPALDLSSAAPSVRDLVTRLYAGPGTIGPFFDADRTRFQQALRQIGVDPQRPDPVQRIRSRFVREATRDEVRALLGCVDEFQGCFDALPQTTQARWAAVRVTGGVLSRSIFEGELPGIVKQARVGAGADDNFEAGRDSPDSVLRGSALKDEPNLP